MVKNNAGIRLGGASVVMTLGGIREGPPGVTGGWCAGPGQL